MQGREQLIVIPLSQLNFGGQLTAYTLGNPNPQMISLSVLPYPSDNGPDNAPLVQTNTGTSENKEKQPL
jgi:hypothetical protein